MTLNILAASRHAVYLTGDFRLSCGAFVTDDLSIQKMVPVVKLGWCALVAFSGIARTRFGLDVGQWIAEQARPGHMRERLADFLDRLQSADSWLPRVASHDRMLTIVVTGFEDRNPFVHVLSNCESADGMPVPLTSRLARLPKFKPKTPAVRVFGSGGSGVAEKDRCSLRELLAAGHDQLAMIKQLATINAAAAGQVGSVSTQCVTGVMDACGAGQIRHFGIDLTGGYVPDFVTRNMAAIGLVGHERVFDEQGKPLPIGWVGMTFKREGEIGKGAAVLEFHAFRNVGKAVVAGTIPPGTHVYSKIAGPDEPPYYTFTIGTRSQTIASLR